MKHPTTAKAENKNVRVLSFNPCEIIVYYAPKAGCMWISELPCRPFFLWALASSFSWVFCPAPRPLLYSQGLSLCLITCAHANLRRSQGRVGRVGAKEAISFLCSSILEGHCRAGPPKSALNFSEYLKHKTVDRFALRDFGKGS